MGKANGGGGDNVGDGLGRVGESNGGKKRTAN